MPCNMLLASHHNARTHGRVFLATIMSKVSHAHAHAVQADEEQLLLDAIDMAGFGNWTAVSEHVGSKSKEECKVSFLP